MPDGGYLYTDKLLEEAIEQDYSFDRVSHLNGVVGVIMKMNGSYDWLKYMTTNTDGCRVQNFNSYKLYDIINNNRFNQNPKVYSCPNCHCINELTGNYISFVEEDTFLDNPENYIDNAYDKSENDANGYVLTITS